MSAGVQPYDNSEESYWKAVEDWIAATKKRYGGFSRAELTQCFMRGPFAGWSERQVAELADLLADNATRFPLSKREVAEAGEKSDPKADGDAASGNGPDDEGGDYCPVCRSCGEDGCCSTENSILSHGCRYAQYYARQVCYDQMVIDEFHKLAKEIGLERDETGSEIKDPIGDLYDRAWKRVEEKYGKPSRDGGGETPMTTP